jgi:hypothetical protein
MRPEGPWLEVKLPNGMTDDTILLQGQAKLYWPRGPVIDIQVRFIEVRMVAVEEAAATVSVQFKR